MNLAVEEVTVRGERWFPSDRTFAEEMPELWGDWYCDSEVGKLRAVLMHRPGPEIDNMKDPAPYRFKALMDPEKARAQHDALAEIYRQHGVKVYYVEQTRLDRPNAIFMRDLMFMTPEGAIIGRPAMASRRGEERYVAEALAKLGVPIIKTVNGDGIFEGACAMWVDRETVILGTGSRCNQSGAAQVESELRNIGVKYVIKFQIPYGHAHIDGLMNIADRKTAIVFPWQVPYDVCKALLDRGFTILEATDIREVKLTFGVNFVALEPGKVVMPAGNKNCKAVLESAGISVIEVDISELMKGWGAVHCMTAFLKRDPI
ncbi:MAG: dimethylarginine dimethylaminohydrolase family protein [Bacillota bacterium]